jgi:hypothetical protein
MCADWPWRLFSKRNSFQWKLRNAGGPFVVLVDALAANFARQHHELRGRQCLAGDAGFAVDAEEQVDDRIGNLVGNLVGVPFGNAFGREQIALAHAVSIPRTPDHPGKVTPSS